MDFIRMTNLDLRDKKVLIRADLNVPIKNGKVSSAVRIDATLPTIEHCLKAGAKVMLMSHLGRPIEGEYDAQFSLQPVVDYLAQKLSQPVRLVKDYLNGLGVESNELVVLENVRFNVGENDDDEALSKSMRHCAIFL